MSRSVPGMFSAELKQAVQTAKILIVGAGGIGSEILKNVVLTGFQDITIIDLDTIDVSNLNRQFLFHKEHVGMPKSIVARDSALKFNPDVKIHAYHDNITKQDYNMNFFKTFTLVMNALDNRQARNHVNRMCLAADVPLIESGTAGFNGQVELIKKNVSSCYECTPKMGQRTYPSCTIRNTPSEPVHCIVWAKHLFNQLFGNYTDEEDVTPNYSDKTSDETADDDEHNGNKVQESTNKTTTIPTRVYAEKHEYDGETMFSKLFTHDIQYLLEMSHLWEKRKPPMPLYFATYKKLLSDNEQNNENVESKNMIVWTIEKSVKMFLESLKVLRDRKSDGNQYLVWDKDDNAAMDFVAACANIRAHIFGIEMQSRFQIKSIAGNIIPAIASSNAIIAAVVVMRSLKVLMGEYESCPTVYLREFPTAFGRKRTLVPEKKLVKPNPKCCVCSEKNEVNVIVDLDKTTMAEFRDQVLVKALNMIAPDIILADKNAVILSSEEGETDYNNEKSLRDVGVIDGSILKVDDFLQNYELHVIVTEQAHTDEEEPLFKLVYDSEKLQEALKPKKDDAVESNGNSTKTHAGSNGGDDGSDDDDANVESDDSFGCIETTVTDIDLCEELVTPTKKVRLSNVNPARVGCEETDDDIITL